MSRAMEITCLQGFRQGDVSRSLPSQNDFETEIAQRIPDKIHGEADIGCTYDPEEGRSTIYYIRWNGSKWLYGVKEPGSAEIKEMAGTYGETPEFDFYFKFSPIEVGGPDIGIRNGFAKGNAFITEAVRFGSLRAIGLRH